jgi:hypothetical protein
MAFSQEFRAGQEPAKGSLRFDDSAFPELGEFIEALGAAASFGRWFAGPGGEEALLFEPIESCVKRAWRGLAMRTCFDFGPDADAIRGVFQAKNGQEDNLFEFPESGSRLHNNYKIE